MNVLNMIKISNSIVDSIRLRFDRYLILCLMLDMVDRIDMFMMMISVVISLIVDGMGGVLF